MPDATEPVAAAQRDDDRPVEALIEAYERGPALLRDSAAGMDSASLRARPVEGRMSTLEVVCHVADCEQFLADRMKRTIATDKPLLMGVDGSRYLEALKYHERDLDLQLALVDMTRSQMAADLRRLPHDAWGRTAVHTETGVVTLRQQLLHAIRHLEHHVAAIEDKRRALGLA